MICQLCIAPRLAEWNTKPLLPYIFLERSICRVESDRERVPLSGEVLPKVAFKSTLLFTCAATRRVCDRGVLLSTVNLNSDFPFPYSLLQKGPQLLIILPFTVTMMIERPLQEQST